MTSRILLFWCFLFGASLALRPHSPRGLGKPRIVKGQDAELGQFPWQAEVRIFIFPNEMISCGGVLISDEWILSSANCLQGLDEVDVYLATINTYEPGSIAQISPEQILHEDYNPQTLANDIALVRLETPIVFNENVSAIALVDTDLEDPVEGTISGWGYLDYDGVERTPILQYATVSTISNPDCVGFYGEEYVTEKIICTMGAKGETPCFGDAGGPLVVNVDSDPVLVGLFSFLSDYGCHPDYPAGYTRIGQYRDWIKEKIGL